MADTNKQTKWFTMSSEAVAKELGVDRAKGLSKAEAQARLTRPG